MKKPFHYLAAIIILLPALNLNAQGQWLLNGNTGTGGAFIGTFDNNYFPIRTANVEAMRIDASQNIGIGTPTPANLFHIDGNTAGTGEVFRTDAPNSTSGDHTYWRLLHGGTELFNIHSLYNEDHISIGTVESGHLNFFTNGSSNSYLRIVGSGTNDGYVGIGTDYTPTYKLDVDDGDINVNTITKGYRIADEYVVRINSGSTFLGLNTGPSTSTSVNTFIGNSAGYNNTNGNENVFIGNEAGYMGDGSDKNVYIGATSGYTSEDGENNTFIGYQSGYYNTADNNTSIGCLAGFYNTSGIQNIFMGSFSGLDANVNSGNTSGSQNIFVGFHAGGSNRTGSYNTFIGHEAQAIGGNADELENATALGAYAYVSKDNSLVLGSIGDMNGAPEDAHIRVGIGTPAPEYKLHIEDISTGKGAHVLASRIIGNGDNYSVWAHAQNADNMNIGLHGEATHTIGTTIGVRGIANGSNFVNVGGWFEAPNTNTGQADVGIHARGRTSALFMGQGIIFGDWIEVSDMRLKDSIENINNALSYISQLSPKSYIFKSDSFPLLYLPSGRHFGLIAQQCDSILPELVESIVMPEVKDSAGTVLLEELDYLGLNYTSLIPLTIAAINELNTSKVSSQTSTDSNYITKWHTATNTLTNSIMYEKDGRIGIGTTLPDATVHIEQDSLAVIFMRENIPTHGAVVVLESARRYNLLSNESGYFKIEDLTAGTDSVRLSIDPSGNVGIGIKEPEARLHVLGKETGAIFVGQQTGAACFSGGGHDWQFGLRATGYDAGITNVGVFGTTEAPPANDTVLNVAIYGKSANSHFANAGVFGAAEDSNTTAMNIGIYGSAAYSDFENTGGIFEAFGASGNNYGIFAAVDTGYAGYFEGDVTITGTLYNPPSDERLKEHIEDITTALDILSQLQPKDFEFKNDHPHMNLPKGKQYGLIAQEVEPVLPGLVKDITHPTRRTEFKNPLGINGQRSNPVSEAVQYKGINYLGLIPILVSGIKEQQHIIDSLSATINERLSTIEGRLNNCCNPENRL